MSKKTQICEDCGAENDTKHKFCSECGNYLLDDTHQHLPKNVAAAVQKLETRLNSNYKSPFWATNIAEPIFKTAAYYLIIAFFYLTLERTSGFYLGSIVNYLYIILRVAELCLPVYLAQHIKNKRQKTYLWIASGLIFAFYLLSFYL